MRNPETGKYQAKKVFKKYSFEVVAEGDTKEEAKENLKKLLEKEYKHPMADHPLYRGPRYQPKMKVAGYVNSSGFVMDTDETGKAVYVFDENRKAQVFTVDRSQNLSNSAKVESEEK